MNNVALVLATFALLTLSAPSTAQGTKTQYIKMPDGVYFPAKEGETYLDTVSEARKRYPKSFGLIRVPQERVMDLDWFNQCRSNVVKDAKTEAAIAQLVASCKYQSVPKKCRVFQIETDSLGNESADSRIQCVESCSEASYYSKTIGECSKG